MEGRVAVVTGAAGGIGLATVRELARCGARIVAADLDGDRLVRALEQAAPGAAAVPGDVTHVEHRRALLAAAADLGGPDVLVLSHGTMRMAPMFEFPEDAWDTIQAVNLTAGFRLCQLFGEHLRDGGAVVVLGSISGKAASTVQNAAYNASKAGIMALVKTFAYALAPHVRVNCVSPGIVETPMQAAAMESLSAATGRSVEELRAGREAAIPLRRVADPAEIARVIRFLCSDDASYMTGQVLNVDGGLVMY